MAGTPSDYQRGTMDIAEQTSTYNLVMALTKWGSLYISAILLFFILLFCTPAGFMGSLVTSVAAAVIGTLMLRDKPAAAAH